MNYPPKVRLWEILLRPSLWLRNHSVDADFDEWLSEKMDLGEPITLCINAMDRTVYEVEIAGLRVWVENAPYADASIKQQLKHSASRRTALRLRRALAPLIRERCRFRPPTSEPVQEKERP
jgi:hypothetical protein